MPEEPDGRLLAQDRREVSHTEGLEEVLRPRLSSRSRMLRAALLVALVMVVAGGLIWRTIASNPSRPPAFVPDATPAPHSPTVLITSNLGFGEVTVNGKRVGTPPVVGRLRPGANTITLDAPPFTPQVCTISWPGAGSDNLACMFGPEQRDRIATVNGSEVVIGSDLMIGVWGASLDAEQCARAVQVVDDAVRAMVFSSDVPAGAHIARGGIGPDQVPLSRVTDAPGTAELTTRVRDLGDRPCAAFQPGGLPGAEEGAPQVPRAWGVSVAIEQQWTFRIAGEGAAARSSVMEGQLYVTYTAPRDPGSAWTVALVGASTGRAAYQDALTNAMCAPGTEALIEVYQLSRQTPYLGWSVETLSADPDKGCLLSLTFGADSSSQAVFLWRFGVLLATDEASRQLLPGVPLAAPQELAAVRTA